MNDDRTQFEELRMRADRTRIDFLRAELDLGFTFTNTAEIEQTLDPPAYRLALDKANEALLIIRRLEERIHDAGARKAIHERANELEKRISSL